MKAEGLFPTPLLTFDIAEHDDIKPKVIALLKQWRNEDPVGFGKSPRNKTWSTKRNGHTRPEFAEFISIIERYAQQARVPHIPDKGLKIRALWGNIGNHESYETTHSHGGGIWAGVYFCQLPPETRGTRFLDPRGGGPGMFGWPDAMTPEVTEGQMILFPVFLPHFVERNLSHEERITFSFNVG